MAQLLAAGERYPNWTDADLREILPDARTRRQVLAEMRPRSRDYFAEVQPQIPGWGRAADGYLLFSEGYRAPLEQAQGLGWPVHALPGGHFHMLVDPPGLAAVLSELILQISTYFPFPPGG